MATKLIQLKFKGDKWAVGKKVGNHIIGQLRGGRVVNTEGVVIGRFRRVVTDGGMLHNWQEIDIFLEVDE